ncbi:hypothetical protein EGW08_001648 [Elysia chlorotica]|uniref:Regucalcin n=1 Tax=Elysia chlorotica TaxID=188477 RepID=A0A433U9S4_ELYCH|nr:hypothetical protein EGW08_001648 [Elysia chlorotica]
MSLPKVEVVLEGCCPSLGEGPHWDTASQTLMYVDICSGGIHCYDPHTKQESKMTLDGTVGFVIPCETGGYVVGLNRTLSHLDWNTKEVTPLLEVDDGTKNRFNDAKCDALGRLWAGTMGYETVPGIIDRADGFLYSFSADRSHTASKQLQDLYISNGMDWTDDYKTMYFIDSIPRKVFAFDFNLDKGKIENQRTVVEFEKDTDETYGVPDGMCIDNEGKIWVACYGGSRIHRFDPETGKTLQTLKFPCRNITSCCFGGKNLDELYVTSSQYNLKPEHGPQPLAGSLFKVTGLGVKGHPANNYKV